MPVTSASSRLRGLTGGGGVTGGRRTRLLQAWLKGPVVEGDTEADGAGRGSGQVKRVCVASMGKPTGAAPGTRCGSRYAGDGITDAGTTSSWVVTAHARDEVPHLGGVCRRGTELAKPFHYDLEFLDELALVDEQLESRVHEAGIVVAD